VVNRLVFMPEPRIRIWGGPLLKMDVVRSADMNRTPDILTRAYLPRWGAEMDIAFVTPALSVHSIISLMANAGIIVGIGDFRQGRGKGSFGIFAVAGDELGEWADAWQAITAEGRMVQLAALAKPVAADDEKRELLAILQAERTWRAA
jgi:hypothetical protein